MKIRSGHILLVFIFCSTYLLSCGTRKFDTKVDRSKKIGTEDLRAILFAKDTIPFEHFYTRIGVDIKTTKEDRWFATSIKMKVDSAFSGTVKVAVIAGVFVINKDSMIYVNKIDKCYFKENLSFISSTLGTEVEYDFFQDLLLGLPIGLDRDIEYKQIKDKEYYILASYRKNKFRRIERKEMIDDAILIQYQMNREDFNLEKIKIQIPADTVDMTIHYKNKKVVSGYTVPNITHLTIVHPRDSINIVINSGVVKIDQPKKIFANIPEDYNECE